MVRTSNPGALGRTPRAVAIGTFDGVHLGHRAVIDAIARSKLRSTVITFDPHPRIVLGRGVALLTTLERRLELIEQARADEALVLPFTPELAATPAPEWIRRVLTPLDARVVVVGEDFRFGKDRRGDVAMLRAAGFEVRPVPLRHGASSSLIRELVAEGAIGEAARLLGRAVELEGRALAGRPGRAESLVRIESAAGSRAALVHPPPGSYRGTACGDPAIVTIVQRSTAGGAPATFARVEGVVVGNGACVSLRLHGERREMTTRSARWNRRPAGATPCRTLGTM